MKNKLFAGVSFALVSLVLFSCNSFLKRGEVSFTVSKQDVQRICSSAREATGTDVNVSINVELSGAVSVNKTNTISSKAESAELNFSFDGIPLEKPVDVEVTVSVGDGVFVLFRGKTTDVYATTGGTPVTVVLKKAEELLAPKLVVTSDDVESDGSVLRLYGESGKVKIRVLTEDGKEYPDCVTSLITYTKDSNDQVMITAKGSNSVELSGLQNGNKLSLTSTVYVGDIYQETEEKNMTVYQQYYVLYDKVDNLKIHPFKSLTNPIYEEGSGTEVLQYCLDPNGEVLYITDDDGLWLNNWNKGTKGNIPEQAQTTNTGYYYLACDNTRNIIAYYLKTEDYDGKLVWCSLQNPDEIIGSYLLREYIPSGPFCMEDGIIYIPKFSPDEKYFTMYFFDTSTETLTSQELDIVIPDNTEEDVNVNYISDCCYQDGNIYFLFHESGYASNYSKMFGRGALVKCGVSGKTVTNSQSYYYYKERNKTRYKNQETSFYIQLYSAQQDNYFYGPCRFVAIKPKKLVVADNGLFFYTPSDETYFRNINRVITIDLESMLWENTKDLDLNYFDDDSQELCIALYTDEDCISNWEGIHIISQES